MTFSIPKHLKELNTLSFDLVLPVELNDTDIDRMLNQITERAIKGGRTISSRTNPKDYKSHLKALQVHPKVHGFEGDEGRRVLDGWLRTSVLRMSTMGWSRTGEQMDYVRPVTIAAYRSGLPKSKARHRRADQLIYRSIIREVQRQGGSQLQSETSRLFLSALGHGVDVGLPPWAEPKYDEHTEVDVNELITLRFLETFEGNRNPIKTGPDQPAPEAVPGAIDPIGRDLVAFLKSYGPSWSPNEIVDGLAGLVAIRLFQLPLRLAHACRALLDGDASSDVDSPDAPNPLQMYCDFTRRRGGPSDELAHQSVVRDLETLRGFLHDRLLLRSVLQASTLTGDHSEVGTLPPGEQLKRLAEIAVDPKIEMALRMQVQNIVNALEDNAAGEQGRELIETTRDAHLPAAQEIAAVLVEGLRKQGLPHQVKWFWTTGGLVVGDVHRPYAILDGVQRAKTTWRYAPAEGMLTVLLSMCFIQPDGRAAASLPIATLLDRLEERYGILIAKPPKNMDTADARSGAAENLQAFTNQLQLLGCFRGLSDDFAAQTVTRPREVKP